MAMSEGKDQVIKLFGKTIPLLDYDEVLSCRREVDNRQQNSRDDDPKTPTPDTESPQPKHHKTEIDLNDMKNPQEKPLKNPDKIIPCPRCNSKETKFCYYNNYNMSQPRHFCKNCQRYWTAGGIMRNIPVGAGRRKNKNPASQYRHVSVSEEVGYDAHYPTIRPNETLLAFGSEMPLCEPMASFFLADKKIQNCSQHDQFKMYLDDENGENRPNVMQNCRIYPPQLPFFSMPFYPQSPFWGYAIQTPWQTPPPSIALVLQLQGSVLETKDSIRQSYVLFDFRFLYKVMKLSRLYSF